MLDGFWKWITALFGRKEFPTQKEIYEFFDLSTSNHLPTATQAIRLILQLTVYFGSRGMDRVQAKKYYRMWLKHINLQTQTGKNEKSENRKV